IYSRNTFTIIHSYNLKNGLQSAVTDQRLIYGGKLLPDYLHIKDLFRQTDTSPTIHLVCPIQNLQQRPLGARPKVRTSASPSPSSLSSTDQTPSTPELRQRRQTSPSSPAAPAHTHAPVSTQITQPAFPTYSLYSPQQLLWLQHVYARQYYMQYQAALAAAGTVPSAPAPTIGQYPPVHAQHVPVAAPLANQNPIDNLQANQNPAQDAAFINPGEANQNMRMNAQGGPVMEDEEDMERDWLDWLYTAARLGVLLMIVYFNSNLSRFLLVMSTLFLMYLHTAGWFPFRRQGQLADRQHEEPAPAADGQEPMTAVLVPPHRVSIMWTTWVFFKTFFSSLLPEVPQRMAN
uniref:Homocysteine-inducible, endoplasmic reticulum stress-inducible, ubiquitin-like domain member 1 n=1 Tax=Labrus bergylta TaxID=56723 RepID=A0A3Q3GL81_9LABR